MGDARALFDKFDMDKSGSITPGEVAEIFKSLGVASSAEDAALMVAKVDKNMDGVIDWEEFQEMLRNTSSGLGKAIASNRASILMMQEQLRKVQSISLLRMHLTTCELSQLLSPAGFVLYTLCALRVIS